MKKYYKGGKSKAIRGLKGYADKAFQAAGFELDYESALDQNSEGQWGFDTDEVDALLVPAPKGVASLLPSKGVKIEKDRDEQNGIKRPSIGGVCRTIWDVCDTMVASGEQPAIADVKALTEEQGISSVTTSIQFYQWRRFNGITGRTKKV